MSSSFIEMATYRPQALAMELDYALSRGALNNTLRSKTQAEDRATRIEAIERNTQTLIDNLAALGIDRDEFPSIDALENELAQAMDAASRLRNEMQASGRWRKAIVETALPGSEATVSVLRRIAAGEAFTVGAEGAPAKSPAYVLRKGGISDAEYQRWCLRFAQLVLQAAGQPATKGSVRRASKPRSKRSS